MVNQRELLNEPTMGEIVAGMFEGRSTAYSSAQLAPLSGRIPVYVMAKLDAMATQAGKSRNAMLNLVIEAGLQAIEAHVSDEVREELRFLECDALSTTLEQETSSGEVY